MSDPSPDHKCIIDRRSNWQPPCQLLHLDVVNGEQYGWGEGPEWSDGSSMVGSWGPAPGILTVLWSEYMQNSTSATDLEYTYPGTPDVGPFWRTNTHDYYASWDPKVDPSTLSKTAEAAIVPVPTAINSGSRGRVRNDGMYMDKARWSDLWLTLSRNQGSPTPLVDSTGILLLVKRVRLLR